MDIGGELHELVEIVPSEEKPVVSVYLNTRWADEQQRRRVSVFVRERSRAARALYDPRGAIGAALGRDLERLQSRVDALVAEPTDAKGAAFFLSEGRGLDRQLLFKVPFEPQFSVAPEPRLLPLARLSEAYRPLLLAVVDERGAEVYETAVGELTFGLSIERPTPSRKHMNGWYQRRYQRGVREKVREHYVEVSQLLTQLFDRDPRTALVIAGPEDQVAQLSALLPHRVRERIVTTLHAKRRVDHGPTLEEVTRALLDHERAAEAGDAEALVGEALAGGLAVLGPEDVALAAEEGRVHRLVLDRTFSQPGWHCPSCDAFGIKAQAGCPYCGGTVSTTDLGEELTRRVLQQGGEVQQLEDGWLRHFDGIGALLRHRGSRAPIGYVFHGMF